MQSIIVTHLIDNETWAGATIFEATIWNTFEEAKKHVDDTYCNLTEVEIIEKEIKDES